MAIAGWLFLIAAPKCWRRAPVTTHAYELALHQRRDEALVTIASLIGALVLARTANDAKLSDEILRATRKRQTA